MIEILIEAFLYIFPAYVANSSAVVFGGGRPIDGGRKYNGKRILGDGKTVRGTFSGILLGFIIGIMIFLVTGNNLFVWLGLFTSVGALSGDIVASFFKRRLGVNRGGLVPLLDQLDFVFGAIVLGSILKLPSLKALVLILVFTPIIHLLTNFIGYSLGLKKEPW